MMIITLAFNILANSLNRFYVIIINMTLLAYIGKLILKQERLNTLVDNIEKNTFNSNFFLLYNGTNIYDHLSIAINNPFYQEGTKVLIAHLYSKIQKVMHAMQKVVRIWKWKTARYSSVETDLFMNSLSNYPANQKFQILQQDTIYKFRITDFIKIWHTALCKSSSFSPMPQYPKNPYTNIPFNKGHLACCYMQLYNTSFTIPPLITIFWNMEMNISKFKEEAYTLLKEEAIRNYMISSATEILFYDIVGMISSLGRQLNNRSVSMNMIPRVKAEFMYDMKPYLHTFLLSEHTCNPIRKRRLRRGVIKDLKDFFKKNPLAGRRIVYPAWRASRQATNNFSFSTNNAIEDAVFIFGAGAPEGAELMEQSSSHDAEESYNEVLDDSDDGLVNEQREDGNITEEVTVNDIESDSDLEVNDD